MSGEIICRGNEGGHVAGELRHVVAVGLVFSKPLFQVPPDGFEHLLLLIVCTSVSGSSTVGGARVDNIRCGRSDRAGSVVDGSVNIKAGIPVTSCVVMVVVLIGKREHGGYEDVVSLVGAFVGPRGFCTGRGDRVDIKVGILSTAPLVPAGSL